MNRPRDPRREDEELRGVTHRLDCDLDEDCTCGATEENVTDMQQTNIRMTVILHHDIVEGLRGHADLHTSWLDDSDGYDADTARLAAEMRRTEVVRSRFVRFTLDQELASILKSRIDIEIRDIEDRIGDMADEAMTCVDAREDRRRLRALLRRLKRSSANLPPP
jgi:hypothetical protein